MNQELVQEWSELAWKSARPDLTSGILACSLVPTGAVIQAVMLTKVESGGLFSLHADEYNHVFLFIGGTGKGRIGDESYDIKPRMLVRVPAGTPHDYQNTGDSDLFLLTINYSELDST
ncbi:MAG: hypothetical protein AM326_01305 [Candidatus Thorarchaeota archaeon SMTZ-45]|nr:MAG: hypothetical protein AM326_01305 [Candidatus Thorarchaeota archaeon SMTZ-45]